LAQTAGVPTDALVDSVHRWNQMVALGEDTDFHRFGPSDTDRPPAIDKPPFFAVQFFPLTRKSMGGVAVDLHCRVLDKRGQPIPGLYAVGELAGAGGINGKAALEGTMLGPSILMGRTAARAVCDEVNSGKQVTAGEGDQSKTAAISTNEAIPDEQTLQSWREVLRQLIAREEPGRVHFRKVHSVVLERAYLCGQCHTEKSPLANTAETLDRRFLTRSCQLCHGARE
jgi:succinate dehydrogenase/fumarate reductase flavoprotein subunit